MGCYPSRARVSTTINVLTRPSDAPRNGRAPLGKHWDNEVSLHKTEAPNNISLPNATKSYYSSQNIADDDVIKPEHPSTASTTSSNMAAVATWSRHMLVPNGETGSGSFAQKNVDPVKETSRWTEVVGHGLKSDDIINTVAPVEETPRNMNYTNHINSTNQTNNIVLSRSKTMMTNSVTSYSYNMDSLHDIGPSLPSNPAFTITDKLNLWQENWPNSSELHGCDASPASKDSQYYSQEPDMWSIRTCTDRSSLVSSTIVDWSDVSSDELVVDDHSGSLNSLSTDDTFPTQYKLRQRYHKYSRPNAARMRRSPKQLATARF